MFAQQYRKKKKKMLRSVFKDDCQSKRSLCACHFHARRVSLTGENRRAARLIWRKNLYPGAAQTLLLLLSRAATQRFLVCQSAVCLLLFLSFLLLLVGSLNVIRLTPRYVTRLSLHRIHFLSPGRRRLIKEIVGLPFLPLTRDNSFMLIDRSRPR